MNNIGADLAMHTLPAQADIAVERTLLTTDVVGSTAILHRFPNDMIAAMDLHDQIMGAVVDAHHGQVFKNTGDGIFAIFDRPFDAVIAAIVVQRALAAAPWGATGRLAVRTGVHTGLVRTRGADFFGPALPAAARLQSAANPDQILISDVTAQRILATKQSLCFELLDLGEHHFKGIEKLRVMQVCARGLPVVFPPIGGKRESAQGNLPAEMSSFLGREAALQELLRLTATTRVMTLVGPGGIGKTRLAIQFARSLEPSFPDGAWMVDLAALERGSDVWPAIAAALLIQPLPGVERRTEVLERLQRARTMLLLDNCEHVLDQIADAVSEIGAVCGSVFLLNTSRRALGVEGEAVYEVAPLRDGARDGAADAAARGGAEPDKAAVRLFIERGRLVEPGFAPDAQDYAMIEQLCDQLDYIPLAIEIAARGLRRVALAEIAQSVATPLDLPTGRVARRNLRQQTLRQTLDWSYALLDPRSQDVLLRLSVFSGPFREDQALAVCAADIPDTKQVLACIDDLLDGSLVMRGPGGGRYLRLLQTVQAFGREKLESLGLLEAVERRHGAVFAARCRSLGAQIASDQEAKAANAIYDDMANLRSAFERTLSRDLGLAADLATPLFLFNYFHRGAETGDWYARIMARPQSDHLRQAPLLLAGAALHALHNLGDPKRAAQFIARGLKAETAGGQSSEGWLPSVAWQIELWAGRAEASIAYHRTAAEQARHEDNRPVEIISLSTAAFVMARRGDFAGADALVAEIRQTGQGATQPTLLGYIHYAMGGVECYRDVSKAIENYRLAVDWALMGGNTLGALRVQHLIADLQATHAEPAEAIAIHVQILRDLPPHGATFYAWSTIRALLAPLMDTRAQRANAAEIVAMIAGALEASPIKLDRAARAAVEQARAAMGVAAYEAVAQRGTKLGLAAARLFIVEALG